MKTIDRILRARHYYELLGVHRGSTDAEISAARRALASHVHPDTCSRSDAHELMAMVNVAADTLLMHEHLYHASLRLKQCPACAGKGFTKKQRGFTKATYAQCSNCAGCGGVK